jgi:phage terminase Nu1 subunit (DNA packaging protein)
MSDRFSGVCSAAELGQLLGLTGRRIQQLAKDNVFKKEGRGKYPIAESVAAYIHYQTELGAKAAGEVDEAEYAQKYKIAKLREVTAKAIKVELENDETARRIAPIEVIELVIGQAASSINSKLDAYVSKVKSHLPHLTVEDVTTMEEVLTEAINDVAELSVDWEEVFDALDAD